MSVEQYQRKVNILDREIADLERKKSAADKKMADFQKKAAGVSISKNASLSTIKSKKAQIEKYQNEAVKASNDSASLSKKISDKRKKRNDAALHLQKEEQKVQKKQERVAKQIQQEYEKQIEELQSRIVSSMSEAYEMEDEDVTEYDVFVSHAWEDKEDFVNSFVEELKSLGITVWYDTERIKWGDSMRTKIDEGLKKSRFGVAILSPDYIAENKYWTKAELDGLFQLDCINGKVLLPVWHNLTKQEVMDYSPIIASKKAMTTALMTAKEIAKELKELIPQE